MAVVETCVSAMLAAVGLELPGPIPVLRFEDVRTGSEPDLAPDDERRICREHGEFVFVEGYPTGKRPFYTHPDPDRPQWSRSFDLLYRGVEIVTGGQRLHRYLDYLAELDARGSTHRRSAATSTRSGGECRRTAVSHSASSGSRHRRSARRMCGRRRCSRGTGRGSARDRPTLRSLWLTYCA
jgi:hypothetical protein